MMIVMLLGFTTHAKYIDLALSYTLCIVWSVCLLICTEMTEVIMNQFRGRWVWPQKTLYTMGSRSLHVNRQFYGLGFA